MKALSIQHPWAWLIVNGYKDIENRDWPTRVRGRFAIHAGKKYDEDGERWVRRNFPDIPLPSRDQLEFGGIVGGARLTDCVASSESPWFQGEYGFVLTDQRPAPTFYPVRGQLGFFEFEVVSPSSRNAAP